MVLSLMSPLPVSAANPRPFAFEVVQRPPAPELSAELGPFPGLVA